MPLQATSGAASYDGFGGGVPAAKNYIEDVFSTYLYTGNGSTQTITNGIDLSTKGGLIWTKSRSNAVAHALVDTVRGNTNILRTNLTNAQFTSTDSVTGFTTTGYTLGADTGSSMVNQSPYTYASWTFRKQPKFFDVVTYTGTGLDRQVSHSLGSTPGCIIVKRTDTTGNWQVWHKDVDAAGFGAMVLNSNAAAPSGNYVFRGASFQTSTEFGVRSDATVNASGGTYVAYLFAHDAGGFGLTGTDNVISCGSFTTNGSGQSTVSLGYEAQWLLVKRSNSTGNWFLVDNMRGFTVTNSTQALYANLSDAEVAINTTYFQPNSTGFFVDTGGASQTYIYVAIRRGPMKVPTSGTSVFAIDSLGGTAPNPPGFNGVLVDWAWKRDKSSADDWFSQSRLTGTNELKLNTTGAATDPSDVQFYYQDGWNTSSATLSTLLSWMFKRAPSFLDVVCYTGTASARTVAHNLGAVPELMIVKTRGTVNNWIVYCSLLNTPAQNRLVLNGNFGQLTTPNATWWNSTNPTSSVFSLSGDTGVNGSGQTQVAYLFATCAGVSKVGSYTGNGSSQTINCGFTGGARFVLIKRTDSTGDWYVWDTARGIVASNDSHLSLNTTAAEVTTDDTIDTGSTGFIVNQVTATNVNVTSATYIFLAIA